MSVYLQFSNLNVNPLDSESGIPKERFLNSDLNYLESHATNAAG